MVEQKGPSRKNNVEPGIVYIAGAGPGDPGLLTVKTAHLLAIADVIIYDRLVNSELLNLCRADATLIYAGKKKGGQGSQSKINELMLSEVKKGKTVLRLKGGDPMVFGRGAEEAEFLRGKDINFEIVPGVSAAFAGPAAAGIPVTHRLLSSSVLVVAGHGSSDGTEQAKVDWKKNAKAADTLVILMGAGIFREIASHLIRGGLNADTPVAAISWATTAKQSTILSTLGTLSRKSRTPKIRPPSVIVVGSVALFAEKLDWFKVGGRSTLKMDPSTERERG